MMRQDSGFSFAGVWTALVTPMDDRGEIDWKAFDLLLDTQIAAGIHGVVPCGTTGESPTLSEDEKRALISHCIKRCTGTATKVMAGTGSNQTKASVELSAWASQAGADACLVVTPYYNKPTFAGVVAHYQAIAKAAGKPMVIYHIPGRTQVALKAEEIIRLAQAIGPCGIKEASGNVAFASDIVDRAQRHGVALDLLASDDILFWPLASIGAKGLVSVTSNAFPKQMMDLYRAATEHRMQDGMVLHQTMVPIFQDLFIETNPGPIKQALEILGLCGRTMRLPMSEMSAENRKRLKTTMQTYS